jgi:hypothetical protein
MCARWQPSSASAEAASFARQVVAACGPHGRDRAKNLLWAAGKLAGYGIGLGLCATCVPLRRASWASTTRRLHARGPTGLAWLPADLFPLAFSTRTAWRTSSFPLKIL